MELFLLYIISCIKSLVFPLGFESLKYFKIISCVCCMRIYVWPKEDCWYHFQSSYFEAGPLVVPSTRVFVVSLSIQWLSHLSGPGVGGFL